MTGASKAPQFLALSLPFQFISTNLFNRTGLVLLYLCGCITTFILFQERDFPWFVYVMASIVWTIPCGFGLAALAFSAMMADLFSVEILQKFFKNVDPSSLLQRSVHAIISLVLFFVVLGIIVQNWFGGGSDGCDGRYPRC